MPKFTVGAGFFANFDTIPIATASGEIVVIDEHLIKFKTEAGQGRPAGFENFIGTFVYNDLGQPIGTVDTYRFVTESDQLVYEIAEANIDTVELRKAAAATGDDPQALLKLIFRSNDRLTGQTLDDQMRAFAGNDRLGGKAGDDSLKGMHGRDALHGNGGDDLLYGGKAGDFLRGGTGDDWLDGGLGRNLLTGGDGNDTFVFVTADRPNRITDFRTGDLIALGFSRLGPDGPLDPAAFHRGPTATKPNQKILYDDDSGWLLYARKGSDTDDPVAFARVGKNVDHLGAEDFVVI